MRREIAQEVSWRGHKTISH